ncbi:hypothetical protein AnigIFM63604_002961 [Aspergillus niger]|uniref:Uncharacterized protein n=2 Tax=Aspergillus niger TaxID=5061 RepID=A2QPU6_ASPNC|nr:hypothetical protein An08g00240 [Aspergillus niger]GLA23223.1 hypothetical protein AnigIFM63326_007813 [Aspergillus niger]GLA47931.1 hypothetical protein AnigIFM63604_002961 [Aspergillus niger]CAK45176.1 hypothetical protein An08g00240 [Aspergillus niger]
MAGTAKPPSSPEVQNALARARESDSGPDADTMAILEGSVHGLWHRIRTEPEYVLNQKEFALFNYFIIRYKKEPECKRAVEQFWNHYRADDSATNGSKT